MTEWEAKYKALSAKLDPKHVEAAEKLVQSAKQLAISTRWSLSHCLNALITAANEIQRNS